MRVLFVSTFAHLPQVRGGLQTTTHDLCLTLREIGAEAAVLCQRTASVQRAAPAPGWTLDTSPGYPVVRADAPETCIEAVATAWNADCIVVQSGPRFVPLLVAALDAGRPTAAYLHNVETHLLDGHLAPDPEVLWFANSAFAADRWGALAALSCHVIPPVVRAAGVLARQDGDGSQAQGGGDRVLFVNPVPVKGVELAFALAAACPELPFTIIESWILDRNWRTYCRRRAHALGNVQWLDPVDDMRPVYAQSRLLLMPSVWEEAFGRTVIEAQLNGLPVLASDRGALPEVVGQGGVTLSPHAPIGEWSNALRTIYSDPSPWSDAARSNAFARTASAPVIAADLLGLLTEHALRVARSTGDPRARWSSVPEDPLRDLRRRLSRIAAASAPAEIPSASDEAGPRIERAWRHREDNERDAALALVEDVLSQHPGCASAWLLQARLEEDRNDFEAAANAYARVVSQEPDHLEAHWRHALIEQRLKRPASALTSVDAVLARAPEDANAHGLRVQVLLDAGRIDEARRHLLLRLRRSSSEATLWHLLADVRLRRGRHAAALRATYRALQLAPDSVAALRLAAWLERAFLLHDRALSRVEKLAALVPDDPDLPVLAARVLAAAGRHADAQREVERGLLRTPYSAAAWFALAEVHALRKRWDAAEDAIHRAIGIDSADPEAWRLLGSILASSDRPSHARLALQRACSLRPGDRDARLELAQAQAQGGDALAALATLEALDAGQSTWTLAIALRARVLAEGGPETPGDADRALAECERLIRLERDSPAGTGTVLRLTGLGVARAARTLDLVSIGARRESWRRAASKALHRHDHDSLQRVAEAGARAFPEDGWLAAAHLYARSLSGIGGTDEMGRQARNWTRERRVRAGSGFVPGNRSDAMSTRPRIAYVMGQPHAELLRRVVAAHAPEAVDVFLFTRTPWDGLPETVRVHALEPRSLAETCALHGIDVAIDCGGLQPFDGQYEVLEAFARRVAPVQAGWLGTLQSSGGLFDVLITDEVALPQAQEAGCEERILRLEGGQWCWDPPLSAPEPGSLPAELTGRITFGVPARSLRLDDGSLDAFARVLSRTEGSRLRFIGAIAGDFPLQRHVRERFARQGVGADRVRFDPSRSAAEYQRWLLGVDMVLDTFPASGGRSLLDVLWMGVPFVTVARDWPGARQGASLLAAIGASDWIASDAEDYVRRASAIAADRASLARTREGLRARVAASGLVNGRRIAAQLEAFAQAMQPHCAAIRSCDDPKARERLHAAWELDGWLAKSASRLRLPPAEAEATPDFSVIVVLYGQAGLSRRALQALADQRGASFETLVVDNASTDRTPELLARTDGARVMRNAENLGFLRAVNQAALRARGRHLLFLNNDAVLQPGALQALRDTLDGDPSVGAVGGRLVLANGELQEAGSRVYRDGSTAGIGRRGDAFGHAARTARSVDYCSGALLATPRALWQKLDGFDEAFAPAYYEDADYCLRVWQTGLRVLYEPRAIARHLEWGSAAPGEAERLMRASRGRFVARHSNWLAEQPAPDPASLDRDPWCSPEDRPHRRPRVLFVENEVPHAWRGGGLPRARQMLRALQDWPVTLFPLWEPEDDWPAVQASVPASVEVALGYGLAGLERLLERRRGTYDVLLVSRPPNLAALAPLRERRPELFEGMRLVYDAEALFATREIAQAALRGHALDPEHARGRIESEVALARGASDVLVVSKLDALPFEAAGYRTRLLCHPAPVRGIVPDISRRRGLLFVGAIVPGTPNEDGLAWLIEEVLPRLDHLPLEARELRIVGACRSARIAALAGEGVRLLGMQDELDPHYDAARVFVAPARFAGGVPLKVIEAAAGGLPVVASALLARQLGWSREGAIRSANDATEFALGIEHLVRDDVRWLSQQAAALDECMRRYDPDQFRRSLREVLACGRTAGEGASRDGC